MKIINHDVNGLQISQRHNDGYINLTQMAHANNKDLHDYLRLKTTKAFIQELSLETGIHGSKIIQVRKGRGNRVQQGTWGHPQVAIHCGQWCSARFAVLVSGWVINWMTTGQNPIAPTSNTPTDLIAEINKLEKLIVSIRSQARTFHSGSHQPADDYLVKSLHTISHNQLSIINSAIQRLQHLKQVAEVNSTLEIGLKTNANINRDEPLNLETEIPASKAQPEPTQQPAAMKEINAAEFIDNIPVITKEATVRFTVDLPESMHRNLSILAAKKGQSKADIIRILLDEALVGVEE